MKTRILGIDPGKSGGLALIEDGVLTGLEPMPVDSILLVTLFNTWKPDLVYLEKAQAMPKNGATSMFNYGMGYGEIIGILKALCVPYTLVRPAQWTKHLHRGLCRKKSAKERSRERALGLFPHSSFLATPRSKVPHDGMLDAALIAEYGRLDQIGGLS